MMAAFGRDSDTVTAADLDAAISELQWAEFAANTNRVPTLSGVQHSDTLPRPAIPGRPSAGYCWRARARPSIERELKPGRLVIGRTPDNDLQIDSKFISRHHCQIVTQPDCVPHRGSEQHQRHLRAVEAREALQPQ